MRTVGDEQRMAPSHPPAAAASDGVTSPGERLAVVDYFIAVLRWRKQILLFVAAAVLLSGIVSFLLPKWYKSTATLLPPRNQSSLSGLGGVSSFLKDFAPTNLAGRLGGAGSGLPNYMAILKSRRASEAVIRRFDLARVYDIDAYSLEKTIKEFEDNYNVEVNEDGSFNVEVYDKDSLRAAEMTNFMVETLNQIALEMGSNEAKSNKLFLEGRVNETRAALSIAEDKMKEFQEKSGLIVLSEDARASASAMGELYVKKVGLDIQLGVLRHSTGEENPVYQQTLLERSELDKKLATFPELGIESIRLFRDVLIQQKILEFLVPLYEQARFEEQKDIPVMLVLDKAVPAEKKSRPKRMLIVAASSLSALIIALMAVATRIRLQGFERDNPGKYHVLKSLLRPRKVPVA